MVLDVQKSAATVNPQASNLVVDATVLISVVQLKEVS